MTVTYKDVVYRVDNYIWCKYRARMHTLIEVRYQIEAYEATEEFVPEKVFRQGHKLGESSWKKTPKEARNNIENELGVELSKNNIVWEDSFSVSIPIIDEKF